MIRVSCYIYIQRQYNETHEALFAKGGKKEKWE
jgi:hypothetical protein